MLIVSAYLIGRQTDINTKLKMRSLSTFMSGPAIVLYIYTQQKKLRKLCLRAMTKDLKHLKTLEFHNSIM